MASNYGYPAPIVDGKIRIGWIGVGIMGGAMARRLLAAGHTLTVYARTPSKAEPLLLAGAQLAPSLVEVAAASDVVFTMLSHPSDVRSVLLADVVPSLLPGAVAVDCTSSNPALAREIAAAARARGCWAVDAPVSGGDAGARNGNLAIFAGGEESVIEWLRPVFEIMGKPTFMGGPGSGQSSKIANQIVVVANLTAVSEALVFAERSGLEKRGFLEALRRGAAGTAVMELFGGKMVEREFEPGGMVEYMVKDLGMGLEDEQGVVLPGAALNRQLFLGMVANGDGKMGIHGLITAIERLNGMQS